MTVHRLFAVALGVLAVASPRDSRAAGVLASGATVNETGGPVSSRPQPFANLFPIPQQRRPEPAPRPRLFTGAPPPSTGSRVVCGLTVVPVDPTFDASMRRSLPPGAPTPASRAVPAPGCGQGMRSERPSPPR